MKPETIALIRKTIQALLDLQRIHLMLEHYPEANKYRDQAHEWMILIGDLKEAHFE